MQRNNKTLFFNSSNADTLYAPYFKVLKNLSILKSLKTKLHVIFPLVTYSAEKHSKVNIKKLVK